MKKRELTLVLPSLLPLDKALIYIDYMKSSDIQNQLFIQFVHLRNGFDNTNKDKAHIERFDTHEILYVPHDRFFGGCDENFLRSQDFCELFKQHVLVIGDDDIFDWDGLIKAIDFFEAHQLEALGLNYTIRQIDDDNNTLLEYSSFAPLGLVTHSCENVLRLKNGEVMDSDIAYMSIVSQCGPLYWPTFIGSHIYSREAYIKILQYFVPEVLYSFSYKQLLFFTTYRVRYAFFDGPIIYQVSKTLMRWRHGNPMWQDYFVSRAIQGRFRVEQMSHIWNAVSFEDDIMFNAFVLAVGTSSVPSDDEVFQHGIYSMLNEYFSWSGDCLQSKIRSGSFYFPGKTAASSLQDIRYTYLFWKRVARCAKQYPEIYIHFTPHLMEKLDELVATLENYLMTMRPNRSLLQTASNLLKYMQRHLIFVSTEPNFDLFFEMNVASFDAYVAHKKKQAPLPKVEAVS